jgi:hypothetical protein
MIKNENRSEIVRYSDESKVFRPFDGSLGGAKEAQSHRVRYWEIVADNLSKAGWSWGCVLAVDHQGRTTWIADAHRGDGKRFIARADEKLTAFIELEAAIRTVLLESHANPSGL